MKRADTQSPSNFNGKVSTNDKSEYRVKPLVRYFQEISRGKTMLWCYLIWYAVTVFYHFDPSPKLWLNSAGISILIGFGLVLSVAPSGTAKSDNWQTFRLFLMPFCVSTFSALTKGKGFYLIFSPDIVELGCAVVMCMTFLLFLKIIQQVKG